MIYSTQAARTQRGQGTEELVAQKSYPSLTKSRQCHDANVWQDAEPLRKDWEGTVAIMMQSGSPHSGRVPLMVITSENVIKILGHERDPVTTSRGLIAEDVNQLL